MQHQHFQLTYGPHDFHGIRAGHGPALLVCLHGFGESAAHFLPLAEGLGRRFTLVALDMPLHGRTVWNGEAPMRKEDLQHILGLLLQQEGFTRFTLLGYSMGGRLALCAVESMAAQLDALVLLAPDGLFANPWHLFVTQTGVGHRLFRYQVTHPAFFFKLLVLARRLGWINESIYKFAYQRMDTEEKRLQVYRVWTTLRRMMPDLHRVALQMRQYQVKLLQVFGQYDRVIPPAFSRRFGNADFPVTTLVLEKGHQLINGSLGETIDTNL
ncbi:MAG TPA: alpha/beta fold hydrolase [Chitinophaga sp.]